MTDYSKLSDPEINKSVAKVYLKSFRFDRIGNVYEGLDSHIGSGERFDPCNNPSDAWPIIVENNISLNPMLNYQSWICKPTGAWLAGACSGKFSAKDKNPLRCAMIVYLMMQEQNND